MSSTYDKWRTSPPNDCRVTNSYESEGFSNVLNRNVEYFVEYGPGGVFYTPDISIEEKPCLGELLEEIETIERRQGDYFL